MLPMMKARHANLIQLADTKEQKDRCDSLLFAIESIEFGDSLASERGKQRNESAPVVAAPTPATQVLLVPEGAKGPCMLSNRDGKPELKCQSYNAMQRDSNAPKGTK